MTIQKNVLHPTRRDFLKLVEEMLNCYFYHRVILVALKHAPLFLFTFYVVMRYTHAIYHILRHISNIVR